MSPVESDQGMFVASSIRDTAVQRQLEKNLMDILECSLNEIYICNANDLSLIRVNQSARQNLGYTIDELRDITPLNFYTEFTEESFYKLKQLTYC